MIGFDIKSTFFDRKAVTSKTDAATRKVLSRFGAFVRTAARSSIRKRKKPSPAGSPPSSHVGLLKKLIYFGYDQNSKSVVIGPEQLNSGKGQAPALLEYGGTTTIKSGGKRRRAMYRARPFMGPALEKEQPKLPAMWAGSVK